MASPKGVLLDVGGTLVHPVGLHAHAWFEALENFGVKADFCEMWAHSTTVLTQLKRLTRIGSPKSDLGG
jgi:beta-phosphoglucomutase-like phosphatase (HAD superfamily)